jgi:alpha-2-macroglobulin
VSRRSPVRALALVVWFAVPLLALADPTAPRSQPQEAQKVQPPQKDGSPNAKNQASPEAPLDDAPPPVRNAILDGDFGKAGDLLAALAREQPQRGDLWLLLGARVSVLRGAPAEAEQALAKLDHDFPESAWRAKARLERAQLLHTLRRDEEAEAIVAAQAGRLLSEARRGELVRRIVALADGHTQPPADSPAATPEFARAIALYTKALELDPPAALAGQIRLELGLVAERSGDAKLAIETLQRFLADGGDAAAAATRDGATARLALGRAKTRGGDLVGARRTLEDLVDALARAQNLAPELATIEADALFAIAATWTLDPKENVPLRIAALRRFLEQQPRHARAWEAAFAIVDGWQHLQRTDDALVAVDWILARPDGEFGGGGADDARRAKAEAAFRRGELLLAQEKSELAQAAFTDCIARDPSGPRWTQAQQRVIEAEFQPGVVAAAHGDFAAARAHHAAFIARHPLDGRVPAMKGAIAGWLAQEAAKRLADAGEKPGEEVVAAATKLRREAIDAWKEIARSMPGSDEGSAALFSAGRLLEVELGDVEAAVETYRACSFGSSAGAAQQRLAEMTAPALSISTARPFSTAEPARIHLCVRNLPEVKVALKRLDLDAYFRKYVGLEQVDQLDLDLIAPDQQLTAKIEGYARWKPIEQELALPVEGAGAWVVVVVAEGKRATTLVLRSDLDIVVKSSRHDVLVYAQDRRTGKPVADASLLIDLLSSSDDSGARRQLEGRTGSDGIFHARRDDLAAAPGVRVLASKEGSFACTGVDLEGLSGAQPLVRRGVVFTDRPAYRPGDAVELRALVREPKEGRLAVPAGGKWSLDVADPAGRVVHHADLPLTKFGSVHDAFVLDPLATVGAYALRLSTGEGPVIAGQFDVLQYELERVTLDLTMARRVWYRGETIEVEARALHHFGAPVSDADLQVTLPDGRVVMLRTDADGRAKTRFDTREQPAEALLTFNALLPAEPVSASATAFVALSEFTAEVALRRAVVLANERFTVNVSTTARDGSPIGKEGRVVVARVGKGGAEVRVDEKPLATGADGKGELSLALEKGGSYLVRFEASDRFGNAISDQRPLDVSDEKDEQRLRILTDRTRLEVGESTTVRLVQRAGAGVVLLTWENETGVEWKLLDAQEGTLPLEILAGDAQVPGFVLAATAVRGTRLHEASAPFVVTRALTLKVTPREAVARPGEETTVELLATDPLGRPVEAEVTLAVVDEALLRLFADRTPDLATVFALGPSAPNRFRTDSSCRFSYAGRSGAIAATVLAEERREEAERHWSDARHALAENLARLGDEKVVDAAEGAALPDLDVARAEAPGAVQQGGGGPSAFASRKVGTGVRGGSGGLTKRGSLPGAKSSHGETADTAFFADVVTGADGRASVTFRMPGQASRFRITARGVTVDSRASTSTASLDSRSDFFAELRLPPLLVEGDAPRFVARLFHGASIAGAADLKLVVKAGDRSETLTGRVELKGAALADFVFDALPALPLVDSLTVQLTATAHAGGGDLTDTIEQTIPVRPYGLERVDSQGGELAASTTFFLELPKELAWRSRRLDLLLGPAAHRFLVDDALRRSPFLARDVEVPGELTQVDTAAELFGLCAVVEMVKARQDAADAADLVALRRRGESLLSRLIATQQRDGGWPWAGARDSDVRTSAVVVAALGRAAKSGFAVPPPVQDAGLQFVEKAFREAPAQADELKSLLLFGLAQHERADFGALNRLHRNRANLSPAALAYTGLALAQSGKLPMAAEIAALIEQRAAATPAPLPGLGEQCRWETTANMPWNRSRIEMAALALMALEAATPKSAAIPKGASWLMAQRPFQPSRAAGFAWAALAGWFTNAAPASNEARVRVRVNDHDVASVAFSGRESATRVPVAADLLGEGPRDGKVKVELTLEGRGRPSFLAALRGFTADVKRRDTPDLRVSRQASLAPAPLLRGKALPTGFNLLATPPKDAWENFVSEIAVGGRADCETIVLRWNSERAPGEEIAPLVLEVPLPAGADVLDGSVTGNFRSFVERPGSLLFELGPVNGSAAVRYTLLGRTPGSYRVLPPIVRGAYDADLEAHGDARTVEILAPGATSKELYRPTPDERFERAKRTYDDGDKAGAAALLEPLLADFGDRMRDAPYRDAARMLLFAALESKDDARIVRSFEILKEKEPEFTLGFEPVLKVAAAYRTMKEHERAFLLESALLDEAFGKDLKVGGLLEEEGKFRAAFALREQLWLDYPESAASLQAWLALSDEMLTLAPKAQDDQRLKIEKLERVELQREGMRLLMRFLTLFSDDPLAPEAGLSLVSAWLSLEDYPATSTLAGQLARRFPTPRFSDPFLYSKAVAEWSLGHDDAAVALLERIATVEYVDDAGRKTPSVNRALAWYILGQIRHARRDAAKAIECYEHVADQFADAREALQSLRERQLALPELTIARPGEPALLKVTSRNLKSAELLVYPVDLLTLCLREKSLTHVADVKLAGIAPVLKSELALKADDPFVSAEQEVRLPLEKAGAYLVLGRADERHASGLVLVTPLDLQVKEEASGRVRTHVLRHADQGYVAGVDVRVVGSDDAEFRAGKSDPRGLFVADGIHGTSTVIARLGSDQYAFWRGTTRLGPPAAGGQSVEQAREGRKGDVDKEAEKEPQQQETYLLNVLEMNRNLQNERQERLKKEIDKERKGVQINKGQ